jgi:phage terminase Nu1 subunit (DNA packaging protein)
MSEVTTNELCGIFGITKQSVYEWIKEGCPTTHNGGQGTGKSYKFDTAAVAAWMQKRAVAKAGGSGAMSKDEAQIRKLSAEAELAELELAKKKELVADLDEVERALANKFAEVGSRLRKVPERCVMRIIGENDETYIKKVILAEIDECLESLAHLDLGDEAETDGEE